MCHFFCNYNTLKIEPFPLRCVDVGEKLYYPDDTGSPATYLIETKFILNSTISNAKKGAQFVSCNFKDLLLAFPMEKP